MRQIFHSTVLSQVNTCQAGYLLIATIIALLSVGAISVAWVNTVMREAETVGGVVAQSKAEEIAHAGIDRAQKHFAEDGNWSNTPATLFSEVSYSGGTYTVTTSNQTQNNILVQSIGRFQNAQSSITRTLMIDPDPNYPGYLRIDLNDLQGAGPNLLKAFLTNMRLYFQDWIWIDKVRIIAPTNTDKDVIRIRMKYGGWYTLWQGVASMGSLIDVMNIVFFGQMTQEFRASFSGNLNPGNITLEIHLTDGSVYSKSATLSGGGDEEEED